MEILWTRPSAAGPPLKAVGTALLIAFGPGSVVAALYLGDGELDDAGLGMISLSFGLVMALVIYAFGTEPLPAQGTAGDITGHRT